MRLRFLGTGAADWAGPDERGEVRRFTSTLLDESLLLDVTCAVLEGWTNSAGGMSIFLTHSHPDHFDPQALLRLAPCRVYAHESWAGEIGGAGIKVVPLRVGVPVRTEDGFEVLPMPSNHSTDRPGETTLHFLIEKEGRRLLYATDGAWLLNREHHLMGDRRLHAAVFDATIGDAFPEDWRVFEHNSVEMVRLMVRSLQRSGRLAPDAPVYLTHLARTLHPDQATLERTLEAPLIPCYDGMTAEI